MNESEFKALAAQGYDRIALVRECLADLETPLSVYCKLNEPGKRKHSFLLESVEGGERFGRYSFIGVSARTSIRSRDDRVEVMRDDEVIESHRGDPLEFIRAYRKRFKVAIRPGLPRFCGGLAGYFGYDLVRFIEPRLGPCTKPDPIGTPDMLFLLVDELAIVDSLRGKLQLVVYADTGKPNAWAQAQSRLRELKARLQLAVLESLPAPGPECAEIRGFDKQDYLEAARKARELIIAGDLMQVQIGQLIQKPFDHPPLALYRALRSINPSPYMYYYDFGDFQVIGASPEILVRQEILETEDPEGATRITIRPIAGTRRRGLSPQQDEALARELLADPKERAEHLMLIDLARNDLGRIAKTGTVRVTEKMVVEKYSHVQHIVSNVEGLLDDGLDVIDVLKASFPAGTLTGAPKVRAMEVIDHMERTRRGIYGGAVGYLSWSGHMDVAIAIRTGIVKDKVLNVQAAAGIVYDSTPEAEWQETEMKARAVLRAAELVEN
ncbi:MAG: anthranilate synthase component I, partial [Betaproteobacteria bacterium]|nr:anthranilate synthase component I [Betaproteobacteria bacterium]